MCQFSFFFIGSAQLTLVGPSVVEKNDCNATVVLPCYVTNLEQNNEKVMFVTWKKQGITIFSYRGETRKSNTVPEFSSARLYSQESLVKGTASLELSSAQATLGNYSCEVTESNREGEIKMELRNGSGELPAIVSEPVGRESEQSLKGKRKIMNMAMYSFKVKYKECNTQAF